MNKYFMAKPTMVKLKKIKLMNKYFMTKLKMIELTMNKINIAKLTKE